MITTVNYYYYLTIVNMKVIVIKNGYTNDVSY